MHNHSKDSAKRALALFERLPQGLERLFREGRGAGKSTTPGGREKHAYFLDKRVAGFRSAVVRKFSARADAKDGTTLLLLPSISFKVNLSTLTGRS